MRLKTMITVLATLLLTGVGVAQAAPNRDAVIGKVMASADGAALKTLIGDAGARRSIGLAIDHNMKAAWSTMTEPVAVQTAGIFADLEVKLLRKAKTSIDDLGVKMGAGGIKAIIDADVLDPASYGVVAGDSDAVKASKWVNFASNTTKGNVAEIAMVARILEEAARKSKLNDAATYNTLNKVLVNSKAPAAPRPIVGDSKLPSSLGGASLFDAYMRDLATKTLGTPGAAWQDVAGYLFGTLIRCHGFVDGNGRTARAAYAIALLQGKVPFQAPALAAENQLTGFEE